MKPRIIPTEISDYLRYEDGCLYWVQKPSANVKSDNEAGCIDKNIGYRRIKFKGAKYYTHRVVWFLVTKEQPPLILDHINNNRLDNRIENLREVTINQNAHNRSMNSNNKSGVKGVCWSTTTNKWVVYIKTGGKQRTLGSYVNLEDAAEASQIARKTLHGEFANHG